MTTRKTKTEPAAGDPAKRITVTLAKELVHRGELKQPGDSVLLKPATIENLRPQGYFTKAKPEANNEPKQ